MTTRGAQAPEADRIRGRAFDNVHGRRRDFLLLTAGAVLAAAVVFAVDPAAPGFYPPCPTHTLTGMYCPGCGSLRAAHALLHGDVLTAASRNLLLLVLAPYIAWEYLSMGLGAFGRGALPRLLSSRPAAWLLVGAMAAFTILRNIPFYPFSLLAP